MRDMEGCEDTPEVGPVETGWRGYHTIWLFLFLSWTLLYIDRAITGPVVTWMITNDVGFMADAPLPHALGGIIGSMFFAGYMLTQFPAGFLGDKYGHKAMIFISLLWSALATLASGLVRGLNAFVALRIFTGLGEGAYYSNDRAVVCAVTPERRRSLGLGVVFTGLALGMTLAFVLTPMILDAGAETLGEERAWSLPFLIFSVPTLLMSLILWKKFAPGKKGVLEAGKRLLPWSFSFLIVLMAVFLGAVYLGLGALAQAGLILLTALVLILIIYRRLGEGSSAVLKDRRLVLLYISAIPLLYTLWFFGFWALLVVSEASQLGLSGAAAYAALFGVANGVGYPLGGRLGDRVGPRRRVQLYVGLCLGVALAVISIAVAAQSDPDPLLLGCLLFVMGVLFASSQTVHMTLTADLAPPGQRGQTFGMWNLVAEVGAVLSPVISGILRDVTGSWTMAILLDAALLLVSAALVALVPSLGSRKAKERRPGEDRQPF